MFSLRRDKTFDDYRLIEGNVEGNEMIYCSMKAPWPVANRDFLQWRRTQIHDSSGSIDLGHVLSILYSTGDVLIVMRSASHPDFPEKQGVVRAETIISGIVQFVYLDCSSQYQDMPCAKEIQREPNYFWLRKQTLEVYYRK